MGGIAPSVRAGIPCPYEASRSASVLLAFSLDT